jgi:hypothetical protein
MRATCVSIVGVATRLKLYTPNPVRGAERSALVDCTVRMYSQRSRQGRTFDAVLGLRTALAAKQRLKKGLGAARIRVHKVASQDAAGRRAHDVRLRRHELRVDADKDESLKE